MLGITQVWVRIDKIEHGKVEVGVRRIVPFMKIKVCTTSDFMAKFKIKKE